MKKTKITSKEITMMIVLAILVIGASYYLFFFSPFQDEKVSLHSQITAADDEMTALQAKATKQSKMKKELDEIFARPAQEITEIAPFDNKETVMNMLYGILGRTDNYSLGFSDPVINDDGTVRRNVSLSFTCDSYRLAKSVIHDLVNSNWRCLVNGVSIAGGDDIMENELNVTASMTFFESTKINSAAAK